MAQHKGVDHDKPDGERPHVQLRHHAQARDVSGVLLPAGGVIARILNQIRLLHYKDDPVFWKHRMHLVKAITRFGFECSKRGWDLDEATVCNTIINVVAKAKHSEIDFLPAYLQSAIDRLVGQKAEELRDAAIRNSTRRSVRKVMNGVDKVDAVREPTLMEQFAAVHSGLTKRLKREPAQAKQMKLL
jgi:hypothetical protein